MGWGDGDTGVGGHLMFRKSRTEALKKIQAQWQAKQAEKKGPPKAKKEG